MTDQHSLPVFSLQKANAMDLKPLYEFGDKDVGFVPATGRTTYIEWLMAEAERIQRVNPTRSLCLVTHKGRYSLGASPAEGLRTGHWLYRGAQI